MVVEWPEMRMIIYIPEVVKSLKSSGLGDGLDNGLGKGRVESGPTFLAWVITNYCKRVNGKKQ